VKLLFLSNDRYPPFRMDVAELFAHRLAALGLTIDWILQPLEAGPARSEPYGGGTAWLGRSVPRTSTRAALINAGLEIANDARLPAIVRRQRPDLIIVRDKVLAALLALVIRRATGTRVAYWQSFPIADAALAAGREGTTRRPWLARLRGRASRIVLYRVIMPRADRVFVQSDQMARDFEAAGVPARLMIPVPMGVALQRMPWPYPIRRVSKPDGLTWVVYHGTLARVRGLGLLVRAMRRVRSVRPDARLLLVGDGDNADDRRAIDDAIADAGLEDAVLRTGFLPMDHVWEYVALADVCVSPFRDIPILQSTSPTKLIEAMALNRPVVASRHPEQDEIIRQSGAGVSVAHAEEAYATAILALLGDPARAAAMGHRGRDWVVRHREYGMIAARVEAALLAIVG
jgi:glycosyltransferase involved in cell wall biosynthesis